MVLRQLATRSSLLRASLRPLTKSSFSSSSSVAATATITTRARTTGRATPLTPSSSSSSTSSPLRPPFHPFHPSFLLQPPGTRLLSDSTRKAIDLAIASAPVVLFMKGTPETPQCGFSRASVQILGLNGVDPAKFAAFNVLEDDELRAGIKEYSEWPTIPQLYLNGEFLGGCDILMNMHKDGSLGAVLEEKGVLVLEEGQGGQQGEKEKEK